MSKFCVETTLDLQRGNFLLNNVKMQVYEDHKAQHTVIIKGDVKNGENILTRVHSQCHTGDLFGSLHCDCGEQLTKTFELIAKQDQGIIIYLDGHEGRGIGLVNKLKAYNLQQTKSLNTLEANEALGFKKDSRSYVIVNDILQSLQVKTICLLTNNPDKKTALKAWLASTLPLTTTPNEKNLKYLLSKKDLCDHIDLIT
jgi:3,4-dihydroxy 2-butanone 4-phosphate synthase/GTP cyclohydrolase II